MNELSPGGGESVVARKRNARLSLYSRIKLYQDLVSVVRRTVIGLVIRECLRELIKWLERFWQEFPENFDLVAG